MQLNINSDAVVKFTNTLEKLHKSGLPVAIRESLNNAAFDVKKRTMPKAAGDTFKERSKMLGRLSHHLKSLEAQDKVKWKKIQKAGSRSKFSRA